MTDNAAERRTDSDLGGQSSGYRPANDAAVSRPMEHTRLVRSDASALAELQLHWGSAYEIGLDGDIWSATFRGTTDALRAHTGLELRLLIRADYAYRQQAGPTRRLPGAAEGAGRGDGQPSLGTGQASDSEMIRGERMSL
jgi:hypothetical protein